MPKSLSIGDINVRKYLLYNKSICLPQKAQSLACTAENNRFHGNLRDLRVERSRHVILQIALFILNVILIKWCLYRVNENVT